MDKHLSATNKLARTTSAHDDASIAQAHLDHAVHELLCQSDLSGNTLVLAARILDVQDALYEATGPASSAPPSGGAKPSIEVAIHHLVLAADPVSKGALAELRRILVEVNEHGQR